MTSWMEVATVPNNVVKVNGCEFSPVIEYINAGIATASANYIELVLLRTLDVVAQFASYCSAIYDAGLLAIVT